MKLSRLIAYLNKIHNTYGDMNIEGNILGGERMEFASLCVEDNYKQGYCEADNEERYLLLLELEEYDIYCKPCFRAYEYPTNDDIEVDNWEEDYNANYPYEVRLIDTTEETIIDTWRYSFKQNATEMVKTLKKKYENDNNLQVELEIIGA